VHQKAAIKSLTPHYEKIIARISPKKLPILDEIIVKPPSNCPKIIARLLPLKLPILEEIIGK
jgi:hypothetical protein